MGEISHELHLIEKLLNEETETKTAARESQPAIARETGIPQPTISRHPKKPEIREMVERFQSELVQIRPKR